jgi:hypothetical protein
LQQVAEQGKRQVKVVNQTVRRHIPGRTPKVQRRAVALLQRRGFSSKGDF